MEANGVHIKLIYYNGLIILMHFLHLFVFPCYTLPSQFTFFGSTLTIGGVVGAIASGMIADSMGRRAVSPSVCLQRTLGVVVKFQ